MSIELLDKTRKINRLLNQHSANFVDFREFCCVLSNALSTNVVLISRKGKVLGMIEREEILVLSSLKGIFYGNYVDSKLADRLMDILSTNENVNPGILGGFPEESGRYHIMITPVSMGGERLGSLFVYRMEEGFSIDDVILNEYAATVIGFAMQRSVSEELTEENRKEHEMAAVYHTLSRLEKRAIVSVIEEMSGEQEAMIVTSKLSEKVGITRSVIVNALKKCVSAGIIETKSAGKKGTYVKIRNELFFKSFPLQFPFGMNG